jgi:type I site-specific restriction-modification system R (restriction) subunit
MRNAIPNANYIGFTGTPLFKNDEITKHVFGDYISTYDFQRAVQDGATVPLLEWLYPSYFFSERYEAHKSSSNRTV